MESRSARMVFMRDDAARQVPVRRFCGDPFEASISLPAKSRASQAAGVGKGNGCSKSASNELVRAARPGASMASVLASKRERIGLLVEAWVELRAADPCE